MFCGKCGAAIEPGNQFCTRCGAPAPAAGGAPVGTAVASAAAPVPPALVYSAPPASGAQPQYGAPPYYAPPTPASHGTTMNVVGIVFVVLGIIAALVATGLSWEESYIWAAGVFLTATFLFVIAGVFFALARRR